MRNSLKSLLFIVALITGSIDAVSLQAQTITTIAGGGLAGLGDGGPATSGKLNNPTNIVVDAAGNVYIADMGNGRIRKIDPLGIITTVAGGGAGGDGGPAISAMLHQPNGVTFDAAGNLYIAEMASSGGNRIRKVNTAGIISTVAGNGTPGFSGDGGPAVLASLTQPSGVAIDPSGNIYIADWGNNRIRKVNTSGTISTIAGGGFSLGDGGPAISATLNNPYSVSLDLAGNLYISDEHNYRLRKVDLSGIITTVAGTGVAGGTGDGGPAIAALFNEPDGIVADAGSLYIADYSNNRVRTVNLSTGIVTTAAGTGTPGFSGDGLPATAAELNGPSGVALDVTGNVYISDFANNRIRKININNHIPTFIGGHLQSLTTCENVVSVPIDSMLAIQDSDIGQTETWVIYKSPKHGTAVVSYTTTSTGDTILPSGLTYSPAFGFFGNDTFKIKVDDRISIDTTTIVVTIKPLPAPGPVKGLSALCIGSTITLSDDTTGGVWSSSNGTASVAAGVVTGLFSGKDTIIYAVTNTCGITKVTKTIMIDTFPSAGIIKGLSNVCIGGVVVLSDSIAGGVWSCTNSTAKVSSGIVTGLAPGTDSILYSISNTCGTANAVHTVTMTIYVPHTNPITGTTSVFCAGTSITLSETTTGGIWGSTNSHAVVVGGIVTGVSGGLDTITYTIMNTCGYAVATYPITINPLPNPGNILGTNHTCPGFTEVLSNYVAGGTWSCSNNSIATISTTGVVKGIAPGVVTISYTTTNPCGTSIGKYPFTVLPPSSCTAAVSAIGKNNPIKIFPNPTTGSFTIELQEANAVITIMDIYGKTIETRTTSSPINSFSLNNIASGTYIIKIQTAERTSREKIMVW